MKEEVQKNKLSKDEYEKLKKAERRKNNKNKKKSTQNGNE